MSKAQAKSEIKSLMAKLGKARELNVKKRLRRQLRKLGHKGGLAVA